MQRIRPSVLQCSLTSTIPFTAQLVLGLHQADSREDNDEIEKSKTFCAIHGFVVLHTMFQLGKVICAKYKKK